LGLVCAKNSEDNSEDNYPSLLDLEGKLKISESKWNIALLQCKKRDPNKYFLMVEGMRIEEGQKRLVVLRRYDYKSTKLYSKSVEPSKALKVFVDEVLKGEEVSGKCWPITNKKVTELEDIIQRKNGGIASLFNRVASNLTCHRSCRVQPSSEFWAKDVLHDLGTKDINKDLSEESDLDKDDEKKIFSMMNMGKG
jgi:hypothetical protein